MHGRRFTMINGFATRPLLAVGVALALSGVPSVWAQVPSAGQVMRDIESLAPAPLPSAPVQVDMPPPSAPSQATPGGGMQLQVKGFEIDGNQVFNREQLLELLADLPGQSLDLAGLRAAAQRITQYYQAHGYALARAFLPAPDIDQGIVRIQVLEGYYGRIELNNRSRVIDAVLQQPLSALRAGEAVYDADLEQSLLLLSDLPGVEVKGTLRPGSLPGSTDLVVDAEPGPWYAGTLEADNYGDRYTGEYRLGASLVLNNPLRLGDALNMRLLQSDQHQRYYRFGYSLPVGPWSTTLGTSYSRMSYQLGKDVEVLEAKGQATVRSFFALQPLIRSRTFNLSAQLQFDDKQLQDDIDLFDLRSPKHVELWTLGINASGQDRWLGGGQSFVSLSYSAGRLGIGGAVDRTMDRLSAGAAGHFTRANLSLGRLQYLSPRWQLYSQLNAQWAGNNLDSSEKFGLGGPNGVRAYALGAGSGDQGWQASTELRYLAAPGVQLSGFADRGVITVSKRPWTAQSNQRSLTAAGVSASWRRAGQQLSVTAAWPIHGTEQNDAPHQDPRVWFSAIQYF